jgi:phosphofructokinase-like protein
MKSAVKKIGVLTGGGDCPGLNAVIRAVVKTAILQYGWQVIGIEDGFDGLIFPDKTRLLGLEDVRGILPRGGTILGTTNRSNPFAYLVTIDDTTILSDLSDQVLSRFRSLGMDVLVVIGGDGSLHIAYDLMMKGLPVFGIPKTIDNDLMHTAVSFGFDTALNTAMEALDRLHTTAESHHRLIVLELMGREAGWISLEAGISGGADVILIPEIPYDLTWIIDKLQDRQRSGSRFSLIVIAEGAFPQGGAVQYLPAQDPGSPRRLSGAGEALAHALQSALRAEIRVTVLGHLQRGGSPSAFDRLLSSRFGAMAVHAIASGEIGRMVALRDQQIITVSLAEAIGKQKLVLLDSDVITTALSLGICLGIDPKKVQST